MWILQTPNDTSTFKFMVYLLSIDRIQRQGRPIPLSPLLDESFEKQRMSFMHILVRSVKSRQINETITTYIEVGKMEESTQTNRQCLHVI